MINKSAYHWLMQRITAIIMLPIPLLLPIVLNMFTYSVEHARELILMHPIKLILITLLFYVAIYHAMLGIIVILEDYISSQKLRIAIIITVKVIFIITLLLSLMAVIMFCFFAL
ncbi:succinate dehydrogenase, hydrophobic membrane anchor protein [Candidatus Neoehrlichia procyonis]|uniref:Succinate dehydrogenase hydrophobic membrane anchor subunit n=1 Tax=Candidatus Neoehrlichia procyonis str. RAC413 TaxID=1359163 RepID=A0A0F3NRU1_9RICK|nr:succinate dehydrogenase, hydrophobic membrane anchor protein [Candidatus Neoehrlichia lotoris]KJV69594.1 succinate dehydrogenase, hydrophobic membrane anchor protein [Candidatus Neoehrlichia lotoris str. RAC413]